MKLVVIESPYAGDTVEIEENIKYARECVKDCLNRGEAPIASHLLYTQPGILDDGVAEERKLGIDAGLCWAEKAEYAVFYVDKGLSKGVVAAFHFYREKGIPCVARSLHFDMDASLENLQNFNKVMAR